ncbi:hypothetical protein [Amycolatopsis sp. cmx-4-68]|uniref:hypothetical protein n=1 Tax=Amycolatopsis sp. cmx-4-68 TaxID=2790938 RepID=UPI00397BD934
MHGDDTRVAQVVISVLGGFLVAVGVAAAGALLLLIALAHGHRDWTTAGGTFTVFGAGTAWTVIAGVAAIRVSRRTRARTIWLTGLPCVALGAVPAAVVATGLLLLPG